MDKEKLKLELMKFAKYAKKQGGSSWCEIPESGIDMYLDQIPYKMRKTNIIRTFIKYKHLIKHEDLIENFEYDQYGSMEITVDEDFYVISSRIIPAGK